MTTYIKGYVTLCNVGGYWSCASGDIKNLIYHVTSPNHLIEESYKFMIGNFSLYVSTLPSLVTIGIVIKESCDYLDESL